MTSHPYGVVRRAGNVEVVSCMREHLRQITHRHHDAGADTS